MNDRLVRLEAARFLDWRFLLPSPELGRVAWVGSADPEVEEPMRQVAAAYAAGSATSLMGRGPWDVAISGAEDASSSLQLVRPGGWLITNVPGRAHGSLRRVADALASGGTEVRRCWHLPDRRRALRIVPIDDRDALRHALTRHGSSRPRRAMAAVARGLVAAGVPAGVLGGEVSVLARRPGGAPISGWPSLESMALTLEGVLEGARPSWVLLTPRFPGSGHVVMLLLVDGAVRLVAKIARLVDDEAPRHEARILALLARASVPPGVAPRLVATGDAAGHPVMLEEALDGRPLDRRLVRGDPTRWIGAVCRWLARLPEPIARHEVGDLLAAPLHSGRARLADDGRLVRLVDRTGELLASLDGVELRAAFEHGDLSHPNLLVDDQGEIGVLDWELAREHGLPLHDLCFFLGYVALAVFGEDHDPFEAFLRVLSHRSWGATDALRAEAARHGVPRQAVPVLIAASWARVALERSEPYRRRPGSSGEPAVASRYHQLWEGAVDRQAQLRALLI